MNSRFSELKKPLDPKSGDPSTAASSAVIEMEGIENFKEFDKIKANLKIIQENTEAIEKLRQDTKLEVKDSEQREIMQELDKIMTQTQSKAVDTKNQFDLLNRQLTDQETRNGSSNSLLIKRNLLRTSMKHFQDAMRNYQDASTRFKQSLRARIARQALSVNEHITEAQIDAMVDSGDPGKFFREELGLADELLDATAEIEERFEGMKRIEQGVREIQELFQQLAVLIDVQQETLDSIEKNVAQTKNYTQKAHSEVRKAEKSQIKSRKCTCYIMLGVVIILIIVVTTSVLVKN